jgi:dolichyl-phosphate-mannose--protein O-mannosyl transferase
MIIHSPDKPVTCGSAIKLTHIESGAKHYLSSENKNLGSGSGQQIVTWIPTKSQTSALWWLQESNDADTCKPGTPIRCGEKIRLTHLETKRNLHTHGIPSPLSKQQEISGFGEDGKGDTGDDWIVECSTKLWMRDQQVRFFHVDTQKYLAGSANVKFTAQNCGHNCPILHHLEAFGRKQKDDYSFVKVEMGVLLSQ